MSFVPPSCNADHGQQLSPDDDVRIAREAIAQGDLRHAAHHVAGALGVDPLHPDHLSLADELCDLYEDPIALVPPTRPSTYYGTIALRGWFQHRLGQHDEAIFDVLCVLGVRPLLPYHRWIERWWAEPAVRDALTAWSLARGLNALFDGVGPSADGREALKSMIPVLVPLIEHALPHDDTKMLGGLHSKLFRIAGDHQQAASIAMANDARNPTFMSAVFVAGAFREMGQLETAIQWNRTAAQRDPNNPVVYLDIGDLQLDLGRYEEAAVAYEHVLQHEPDNEWAKASAPYARWILTGDPALRDQLEILASQPDAFRARDLCDAITPYLGYLPNPTESIVNVARSLWKESVPSEPMNIAISAIEAPSAVHSVLRWFRSRGATPTITAKVQNPDPRVQMGQADFVLWQYNGSTDAIAQFPRPSEAILQSVSELAMRRYHAFAWSRAAQAVGRSLGVSAVPSLLGAINHPPPAPQGIQPWDWDFRAVMAAVFLLAFVDDGWMQSQRRRVLYSLLMGPLDWSTTGAIVALTQLAHEVPDATDEIVAQFGQLLGRPVEPLWHMVGRTPAVHCGLQLPKLDAQKYQSLLAMRAEIERT